MQRMSLEAPGTFDHTIRIANLVEAACNAIGANGLLGRNQVFRHWREFTRPIPGVNEQFRDARMNFLSDCH